MPTPDDWEEFWHDKDAYGLTNEQVADIIDSIKRASDRQITELSRRLRHEDEMRTGASLIARAG